MNSNDALLTVNVVTYNHKDYIAECLDSILSQKTNFDFVIRIFDDCSTDGTTEICREYADKFPDKIQFYPADTNTGALANCLRSYKDINTKYYMFIEGDDYCCDIEKFQIQVDILEKHPDCSFCACDTTIEFLQGIITDKYPHLTQKIYTLNELKNTSTYFQTSIASRIVRTSCIKIDPDHPEIFITDTPQSYVLLEQGNMFLVERIMNVYRITNSGLFQGKALVDKMKMVFEWFMNFNQYFDEEYEQLILFHLLNDLRFSYNLKYNHYWEIQASTAYEINEDMSLKNRIKRMKHYLLPPVMIDILNLPRDFARLIKKKKKKN